MKFDFSKVADFDEHIELSIPNVLTLDKIFRQITHEYAQPESTVIDLGCSTGRFLISLNQLSDCNYVGIDEVNMKDRKQGFNFFQGDAEDYFNQNTDSVSVLISMFFFSFVVRQNEQDC